ncbi:MAG: hypothetical protein AAFQ09_10370 [Pseudomonadota bacterium]
MTDPNDDMLDDLLAEARRQAPTPSDALLARVIDDALPPPHKAPRQTWDFITPLFDVIGGWPSAGGLVAATLAGLWLGIAPPAAVQDLAASALGTPVTVGIFSDELAFDMGGLADG